QQTGLFVFSYMHQEQVVGPGLEETAHTVGVHVLPVAIDGAKRRPAASVGAVVQVVAHTGHGVVVDIHSASGLLCGEDVQRFSETVDNQPATDRLPIDCGGK